MKTSSRLDDLVMAALLDGSGVVLFEERDGDGLLPRLSEAARLCGREGDLAVLDLSTGPASECARRAAAGIDLRTLDPAAAAAFAADLAVPAGDLRARLRVRVREVALGYLSAVSRSARGLGDLAALSEAPADGDVEAVRLALARLKLHIHRHARCLGPGAPRGIDPVRDGSILVVLHDRGGGDLAAAVAGLLARSGAGRGCLVLAARSSRGSIGLPPPWLRSLQRHGVRLRQVPGGWATAGRGAAVATGHTVDRLRAAHDIGVTARRDGRTLVVSRGADRVLASADGREILLVGRARDGWVWHALLDGSGPVARPLVHALALAALLGLVDPGVSGPVEVPGAGRWEGVNLSPEALPDRISRAAGASPLAAGFLSGLDIALSVACHESGRAAELHGWVVRGGAAARGRRDFACTWRALAPIAWRPEVERAVDAGAATVPLVAACLGTSRAKARRLQGRARIPSRWLDDIAVPGSTPFPLAHLGHDRLPARGDGPSWDAFVSCVDLLDAIRSGLEGGGPDPALDGRLVDLALAGGADWPARAERLRGHYDPGGSVAAMVAGLASDLREAGYPGPAHAAALGALSRGRDLPALVEVSVRWAARNLRGNPGTARWRALFPGEIELPGGFRARCLVGVEELRSEGSPGPDGEGRLGLDHCVLDHAGACAAGLSHVVSLRGPSGERDSTAEIVPGEDGRPVLAQHKARSNAEPGPDARSAVEALVAMIGGVPGPRPRRTGPARGRGEGAWRPYLPPALALPVPALAERLAATA